MNRRTRLAAHLEYQDHRWQWTGRVWRPVNEPQKGGVTILGVSLVFQTWLLVSLRFIHLVGEQEPDREDHLEVSPHTDWTTQVAAGKETVR